MLAGATLVAPETVFFADTELGRDVVVEPNVVFGPGVTVADDVADPGVLPHRGRDDRKRRRRSARSRGCGRARRSGADAHIGNFVEIKTGGDRARAPRSTTSPISATRMWGRGANIGAGTITCNYDGVDKHRTEIGAGAFIGSEFGAGGAGEDRRRRLSSRPAA